LKVKGTGEHGRVMKEDIQKVASQGQSKEQMFASPKVTLSVQGEVEYVPITKLRKAIVKSMTLAKQIIPHTVLMDEVIVDKLVELRDKVKTQAAAQDIKLTYMAFIMKATVLALKKFPNFNASFDQENDRMVYKKFINLGMAVDTPDGLIVPNIKDADKKSILELAKELRSVADATVARKVQLSQLQNTTFSITNFGAADVAYGTPIINHPEVGILGVGKISQRAVVIDGELKVAYTLPLSLAVDHRVIDGAEAGRFLNTIKSLLNDPMMLLLS
ncbi:MAG: dihydrolipoamide acetyltransferase family protein, partial [Acholeplasmataceae bacterium]|nr:dihydrolipoamide acetyltransferase family protein [Acholeplasmataceae bacterium]